MDVMMRVLYASRFQDGIHMQHYPSSMASLISSTTLDGSQASTFIMSRVTTPPFNLTSCHVYVCALILTVMVTTL